VEAEEAGVAAAAISAAASPEAAAISAAAELLGAGRTKQ